MSDVAKLVNAEPPTGKHSRRAWRHWYADQRRISRRDGQFVCRFGRFFWVAETRAEKPMARRMAKVVHRALRTHDAAMAFGAFVNGRKVETLEDVRALLRAFLSPHMRLFVPRTALAVHDADGIEREIDGMVSGWTADRSREVFEALTAPVDDSAIKSLRFKTVNEIRGEQGLPPVE